MESLKALECGLLVLVRHVGKALDDFTDSVDASLEVDGRGKQLALGVLLTLGDLVVALVGLEQSDYSAGTILCLFLAAGQADGLVVAQADLGGVVQVCQAEGIMSEMLSVELHQLGVPLLSQLPNY